MPPAMKTANAPLWLLQDKMWSSSRGDRTCWSRFPGQKAYLDRFTLLEQLDTFIVTFQRESVGYQWGKVELILPDE